MSGRRRLLRALNSLPRGLGRGLAVRLLVRWLDAATAEAVVAKTAREGRVVRAVRQAPWSLRFDDGEVIGWKELLARAEQGPWWRW